jgi:predicted DNA-binding protein
MLGGEFRLSRGGQAQPASYVPCTIALTGRVPASRLAKMEVNFKPETESRLHELASQSGRPTDELVEDAMAAYLSEVAEVRTLLGSRYDDIQNGRVKPVDGEAFFEDLRRREEHLLKQRSSK